ncbi:DUF4961 domain-containing protein [Desertivirga xinjiangensis]|uniref:DUF4961 domain-containing protein n=1 Tax=Desertivirga xinjiangensis TaxID=539206 RepID=UPI00210DA3A1|nr:DUF4961 domain-containing protein [Pedobacter xinjiangensis]
MKMKYLIENIRYLYLLLGIAVVIFLIQCGLNAFTIEMPDSGNANEVAVFKLHGSTESVIDNSAPDPTYSTRLLVGIMVPKSWNARQNAVLSFKSGKGDEANMVLIPDSEVEPASGLNWSNAAKRRFGIGPNLFDDFEWLVYRSNNVYVFRNDDDINIDVTISCKLGPENMIAKLGFFLGSSKENLRPEDTDYTKFAFSDQFEVKNGTGEVIDFVNPQLSKIEPVKSLDNDIVTFTFDSGVTHTALSNTDDLYLCAKAYGENNTVISEVCEQTARTRLSALGGKRYRLDLWPKGFFDVPSDVIISRIEYHYTDVTGNIKVGFANTADPFKFTFICR